MKFVALKEIPKMRSRNNICVFLEEFINANEKFAEVELKEGEYKKPEYACNVIKECIKKNGYPIQAMKRRDKIYLVRKDM